MTEPELRDTFGEFLVKSGKNYKNLVVLDSDLSSSTRTQKFAKAFPTRFFNMGVAEQNTMGTAIGFSISGKIPVVSGFSIFTTGRAWEFVRHVCHDNLNLKIVATHAGLVGEDGSTHNALEDLSLMAALPNLTIFVPADNIELSQMLEYAISKDGPFYIRLPRGSFPKVHTDEYKFNFQKVDVIKEGNDICLIGVGYGTSLAMQNISDLEKTTKCSIKIINLSCIKPIVIQELIKEVKSIKGLVVIEEHNIYCGVSSIVARIISEFLSLPIKSIGINNSFGQSGPRDVLLNHYGLNKETIVNKIQKILSFKNILT